MRGQQAGARSSPIGGGPAHHWRRAMGISIDFRPANDRPFVSPTVSPTDWTGRFGVGIILLII